MDGLNPYRTARVAEILSDFRSLQYHIAAAPSEPSNAEDQLTDGWTTLRQCALEGQHILNCAADTAVPETTGGEEEQAKAELKQIGLDAFARRHQGQKIFLRQAAAQRWIERRGQILQGARPTSQYRSQLRGSDQQLLGELALITDENVYNDMQSSDLALGRWIGEDPSLRAVQRWVRGRPQTT